MASTYGDWAAITGNGTAHSESAQSTINVTPGAVIIEIAVNSLTVGNTYGVKISAPGMPSPQKYNIPSMSAVLTNGGKIQPSKIIKCAIPVPAGLSSVYVSTYCDVASGTSKVGLKWVA